MISAFMEQEDFIDAGPLAQFAIFASTSTITNTGLTTFSPDNTVGVGAAVGAITGFTPGTYTAYPASPTTVDIANYLVAYNAELRALTATNTTHPAAFVDLEVVPPGIYQIPAAITFAGTVSFDGQGDSNSVIVIRAVGAGSMGAAVNMVLINNMLASNVYILVDGAWSAGATASGIGTIIARDGAIALGAAASHTGRLYAMTAAITTAGNALTLSY